MELKNKLNLPQSNDIDSDGWAWKTFGDVISTCFSGATPSRSHPEYFKGSIRWITSTELNYNIITDTKEKITHEAVKNSNLKLLPKNTFLMAITGLEAEGTRGRCGIVGEEATSNQSCMALFPTNELLVEFLFHYYVYAGEKLAFQYCQGTKQQSYTAQTVKLLPIYLPPLPEQQAIAAALSDVDTLLTSLDALIAKKRLIKQGAMQELLTGKRRLKGFSGEWETKKIGELTHTTAGGTPSTLIESYWGGEIKWMNSGELHLKRVNDVAGRITEAGLNNSSTKIIPPSCILVGLAGQGKTRGTVAMNMVELCTNQSIAAIFPAKSFISDYLYHNLDSRYDELRTLSTGDGGRGGLNLTLINKLEVPLPSLVEQQSICDVLSDMDAEIAALESRREKTRLLKQGMMQELLTGRIRLL